MRDERARIIDRDPARQPGRVATQVTAERAPARHRQHAPGSAGARGTGDRDTDLDHALVLPERPRVSEFLASLPLEPVEPVLGQAVDVDGAHPAQLVEQDAAQLLAAGGIEVGERPAMSPDAVVRCNLREVAVDDPQQAGLLQVGHRDPPAALQVDVELVLDDCTQSLLGIGRRPPPRGGHLRVLGRLQCQLLGHRLGELVVSQTIRPGVEGGGVQCAAQLTDLDEVVEVPRLQAGVLPVVHEREQLARLGRKVAARHLPQRPHHRRADQGHRTGPAFGVKGGQLGEVLAADLLV